MRNGSRKIQVKENKELTQLRKTQFLVVSVLSSTGQALFTCTGTFRRKILVQNIIYT